MKYLILIITLIFISCTFKPVGYDYPPKPMEIRYYDKQGKYTGKSVQQGNTIRYYNKNGKYIGSGRTN